MNTPTETFHITFDIDNSILTLAFGEQPASTSDIILNVT